jgi:type II secretory pathway pseudopilin PulG
LQTFETLRHAVVRRALRVFRPERGSMLIEVMIGALVLAITTTAVLNGLDGAQKTGGRNKARSVAAALAEQDQERMRALPVADLLPLVSTPYTRPVAVKGVDYTVTSSASYATDAGSASTGCSATAKTQTNLRILSSVTSPLTRGTVDLVGLVTPPASSGFGSGQGRLIVKVFDRDDVGVAGATVALSGTASFSEETNASGCAIFPFAPAGNYTADISKFGLVSWEGTSSVTPAPTLTSTAGQTTTYGQYYLDQPVTILAEFDTKVGSAAAVAAKSQYVVVNNPKLAAQRKVFSAASALLQVPAASLFPFLDGYGLYAGQCTNALSNNPGGALPNTTLAPGVLPTATNPDLRVPSINIRVIRDDGAVMPVAVPPTAAIPATTVFIKTADGCATTYPPQTIVNNPSTGGGLASLPEPGFPYGTYKLCAQRTLSGVTRHGHADQRTGAGSGIYDAKSTSAVPAETAANRVDDTIVNTTATGTPTIAANPIYPAAPALPGTNGSIIIRLNRTGPCE